MSLGKTVLELKPSQKNPRNSEGAFAVLSDGRLMFLYTHFTGGRGDHDPALLAARYSSDGGCTWTKKDRVVLKNEARSNIMSVSLLRLQCGELAMFYLRKNSICDCRPHVRFSRDDGETWSAARPVVRAPGYFILNNDRVIQLRNGRLIAPTAYHRNIPAHSGKGFEIDARAIALWNLSDDDGKTWRESEVWRALPADSRSGLQEPGVVELADGRIFSWARTTTGCQWGMYSYDNGVTWTEPAPTEFRSPCSPMSVKSIPGTEHLLAVWNDHSGRFPIVGEKPIFGPRRPLALAISRDNGMTWMNHLVVENDPTRCYCYTAICFPDDKYALLAYGAGKNGHCLGHLRIKRIPIAAFYR
ncbi:MAG: exo-alpha-sialidase [Lentisphaerae bacterium]|nr:exo-alpha-sialidase [Lentisphaerota bacterium]